MKVFVAGHNGQFGRDCMERFGSRHAVAGADLPEFDITRPDAVAATLDGFQPDVIINAAAFTRVDAAETERDQAWLANVEGPRHLARYAAAHGVLLVHVSTDYVFDGSTPPPTPYSETDPPHPACWYGVTKWEGEKAVAESGARHLIFRTAWLYGAHGHNFLRAIWRKALGPSDEPLRVVNDQWGAPTWTRSLARQVERVIDAGGCGLYHATAEGHCTWYDVAVFFLSRMGCPRGVTACSSVDYPTAARRPPNSVLDNARLKAEGLDGMPPWQEDLAEFIRVHRDAFTPA